MIIERFGRGAPSESFAGATVESYGDSYEVGGAMSAQVCAFGKVLTQQTVGVLIAATLPGALRVAEVNLETGIDPQLHVLGHLGTLVPSQ